MMTQNLFVVSQALKLIIDMNWQINYAHKLPSTHETHKTRL